MISVLKRVARVPDEYQEVEYIESTGTQYIDTGVNLNNNSAVEVNAKLTASIQSRSYYLFGSSVAEKRYMIAVGASTNKYLVDFVSSSNRINSSVSAFDSQFHTHKVSNLSYFIDNILQGSKSGLSVENTYSAYLFDVRDRSTASTVGVQCWQIKYCKIYDNNVLIRDFIPCYRKSDNVIGMYDLVNSVFYTNAGTGTFLKGGNIAPYTAERQSINVLEMTLPKEYQQVEYIESTGTQYINSLVLPTVNTGIKVKYAYTEISSDANAGVCGTYQSVNPRTDTLFVTTGSGKTNTYLIICHRGTIINNSPNVPIVDQIYNAEVNYYNSGELVLNNKTGTQGTNGVETYNLIIFARYNKQNGTISVSKSRIYEFKVTELNALIRDFIPCYRKSDNEIGMFDLVSGTFFTNSGTGTFAKGNNVALPIKRVRACILEPVLPSAYQQVEYIESSGTQRIDTATLYDDTKEYKIQVTRAYNRASNSWGASGWNAGGMYGILHYNFGDGTEGNQIAIDFNTYYDIQQIIEKGLGNTITRIAQNGTTLATFTRTHTNVKLRAGNLGYPIFAVASTAFANSYDYFEYSRIKSYKIYQDDVLVRNFIPCYRKSDSVVGLYDLVTKTFYTNSGTGSFLKGADATKYNIIRL